MFFMLIPLEEKKAKTQILAFARRLKILLESRVQLVFCPPEPKLKLRGSVFSLSATNINQRELGGTVLPNNMHC